MKSRLHILTTLLVALCTVVASAEKLPDRALWASINGASNASLGDYQQHTGKVLVSWRMLPGDNADTGFDLYRTIGTGAETLSSFTLTKVQNVNIPTAINNAATYSTSVNSSIYNLSGQRVDVSYKGILIKNGKKVYNK